MPWVREETKIVLLLIAYWKFLSTSDCLSLHFGLPVSGLLHDLQQGREAHCSGVASPKEETLPSLVPLKIVETPAVSPLEIWASVSHCYWWVGHIPQGLGQQKKKKKNREPRLFSLWFLSLFVLSIFTSAFGIFSNRISPFRVPTHFCWFIFTWNSDFVLLDPGSAFSGQVFSYILSKAQTLNCFLLSLPPVNLVLSWALTDKDKLASVCVTLDGSQSTVTYIISVVITIRQDGSKGLNDLTKTTEIVSSRARTQTQVCQFQTLSILVMVTWGPSRYLVLWI